MVKMFRKGAKAFAYQWSGPSSTWVEIGEVTGSNQREELDGQTYDFVWPVEMENPGTGGVETYKLGYNQTEDPFMVADAFIAKNGIDASNRNQIAEHIKKMSQQGDSNLTMGSGSGMDESADAGGTTTYQHFPGRHLIFSSLPKFDKAVEKIHSINE